MEKQAEEQVVRTPAVGDVVAIMHRSKVGKDGLPSGTLEASRKDYTRVVATYLDGDVRVESGDVWSVKPSSNGKAAWMTVAPKRV